MFVLEVFDTRQRILGRCFLLFGCGAGAAAACRRLIRTRSVFYSYYRAPTLLSATVLEDLEPGRLDAIATLGITLSGQPILFLLVEGRKRQGQFENGGTFQAQIWKLEKTKTCGAVEDCALDGVDGSMGSLSISLSGCGDIYSRGVLAGLLVGILSWFWELWLISHSKEGRGQRFRQGVDAQSAGWVRYTHQCVCCHFSLNRKWEMQGQDSYS